MLCNKILIKISKAVADMDTRCGRYGVTDMDCGRYGCNSERLLWELACNGLPAAFTSYNPNTAVFLAKGTSD